MKITLFLLVILSGILAVVGAIVETAGLKGSIFFLGSWIMVWLPLFFIDKKVLKEYKIEFVVSEENIIPDEKEDEKL